MQTSLVTARRMLAPLVLVANAGACVSVSSAPPIPAGPQRTGVEASPPPVATSAAAALDTGPVDPAPASPAETSAPAEVTLGDFVNELAKPVFSLALGRPKVAALGSSGWLSTGGKWQELPFPEALSPGMAADGTRIFFGRDDLPRVMGARLEKGGGEATGTKEQVYLRFRQGRWLAEKHEVGRLLGKPKKALWGVLGHADPEVACKADDVCIIKRLTGWKTIPAGPGTPRVDLWDGVAWALAPDHVARLAGDATWDTVGASAPFTQAEGFCVVGTELWVSEPSMDKLHHHRDGVWSTTPAPTKEPRGLWASRPDDVWLAGREGLFHFDGTSWAHVRGPAGPLREVQGRVAENEIWAAGESGVWSRRAR
jgi:hypothetical protein